MMVKIKDNFKWSIPMKRMGLSLMMMLIVKLERIGVVETGEIQLLRMIIAPLRKRLAIRVASIEII